MFAALLVSAVLAADPEPKQLMLFTEQNPPYNYRIEETGEIEGRITMIVQELMRRADIGYTIELMPWNRAFQRTLITPNSCLFAMDRTPERENQFLWVSPMLESGWSFFRRPDSDIRLTSFRDLAPYRVAATADYASARALVAAGHKDILMATTNIHALRLLYHGRVDFILTGDYEMPHLAERANLPMPVAELTFRRANLSMGCNLKSDRATIDRLQQLNIELEDFKKAVLKIK